jgi:hypothetical protein
MDGQAAEEGTAWMARQRRRGQHGWPGGRAGGREGTAGGGVDGLGEAGEVIRCDRVRGSLGDSGRMLESSSSARENAGLQNERCNPGRELR